LSFCTNSRLTIMSEKEVLNCPVCSGSLNEHPKGSATLFVCSSCNFKILTTEELFPRCFVDKKAQEPIQPGDVKTIKHRTKKGPPEKTPAGIQEMKGYLRMIFDSNDKGIAFLTGSYIQTFEELRKSVINSSLSPENIEFYNFGRLGAILDIFFAYLELKRANNNSHGAEGRTNPYVR
jgi:hypothetical protein